MKSLPKVFFAISLLVLALFLTQGVDAQQINPSKTVSQSELIHMYKSKFRANIIPGLVMVVGGSTLIISGILLNFEAAFSKDSSYRGTWMAVVGIPLTVVGAILCKDAYKYLKKIRLTLNTEKLTIGSFPVYKSDYIALSVKIPF